MKCFQCAVFTASSVVEVIGGGPAGGGPCRATVLCSSCMIEIDLDMWLSGDGWDALTPAVPFEKLPALDHDADGCWDVETYEGVK